MLRVIQIFRWILIIPAAIVGWYTALLFGIFLMSTAERLCPEHLIVSGECIAKWYNLLVDAMILVGAGLSAVLTILFAVIAAPNKKYIVSQIIFISGAIVATVILMSSVSWGPYLWAITFGLITLIQVKKHVEGN